MMSPAVRWITDNPKNDHNAHNDHNDDDHDDDSRPVWNDYVKEHHQEDNTYNSSRRSDGRRVDSSGALIA